MQNKIKKNIFTINLVINVISTETGVNLIFLHNKKDEIFSAKQLLLNIPEHSASDMFTK